jgi:hypothetical protein
MNKSEIENPEEVVLELEKGLEANYDHLWVEQDCLQDQEAEAHAMGYFEPESTGEQPPSPPYAE